jgi:hypothetical protein
MENKENEDGKVTDINEAKKAKEESAKLPEVIPETGVFVIQLEDGSIVVINDVGAKTGLHVKREMPFNETPGFLLEGFAQAMMICNAVNVNTKIARVEDRISRIEQAVIKLSNISVEQPVAVVNNVEIVDAAVEQTPAAAEGEDGGINC